MKGLKFILIGLLSIAFCLGPTATFAQDFLGYSSSNYAGVSGIDLNPASIADSRYKFDMTLVGANASFANNYLGLRKEAIKNKSTVFDYASFSDKYIIERMNSDLKSILVSQQLVIPSFMVTLSPKHALAVNVRERTYFNIDGIEPQLAHDLYTGLQDSLGWVNHYKSKNISVQQMSWIEYGATYARVLVNDNDKFFKAGARLKLLQGMWAAYVYMENIDFNFKNDSILSISNTNVYYGHSNTFTLDQDMPKKIFGSAPSIAFDLGAVYEWRPHREKFLYDMDGETKLDLRNKEKYKLRAGLSILDIGGIKFKKATGGDFRVNLQNWEIDSLASDTSSSPIGNMDSVMASLVTLKEGIIDFSMNLPTAISLQLDYNIWKDFYINFTAFKAFLFKKNKNKVHDLTTYSITPRWDWKWFGVFIPISYNSYKNTAFGLAARLGPLIVGTSNLPAILGMQNVFGANAYFLLKIPIMYGRVKDKDKDKVSNKKDKCKEVPGVWEFMGCPDRDGDHIADNHDECPDTPGSPEFNGCPDKDGDKIIDKKDSCPDVAGIAEFKGCPDKDGDKIIDKRDSCPDEAGLASFFGCPDKDNDKVIDKRDACPNDSGPVDKKGCPDFDGDGIFDKEDRCPDRAGARENDGCPLAQLSLLDKQGNSIATATVNREGKFVFSGTPMDDNSLFKLESFDVLVVNEVTVVSGKWVRVARRGIDGYFHFEVLAMDKNKTGTLEIADVQIKLKKEQAEMVKNAMETLEFDFGSEVIRSSSTDALDLVAELLMQNHMWRLKLSGHTDNVSSLKYNMALSKKRVESIKKYMIKKGVEANRVVLKWYGPTKPIASNNTEEGRQKNRRVEFLIIE